jgi:uncharacterized protein involved in outer membrane biogenesis
MRLFLIAGALLLALCAGGLLVAPMLIDWSFLKPEGPIALDGGLQLSIDGKIDVRLLPQPVVVVTGIRVFTSPGGAAPAAGLPDLVQIQRVSLALDPFALLLGDLKIIRMTVVEPVIEPELLSDGRRNWGNFAKPAVPPDGSDLTVMIAGHRVSLSLPRATIRGGRGNYRTSRGSVAFEALDATIGLDSPVGPFTLDAAARIDGQPVKVNARIGPFAAERPTPVHLIAEQASAAARLELTGEVAAQGSAAYRASGKAGGSVGDMTKLLDEFGIVAPAGLGRRLEFTGDLAASGEAVELGGLTIDLDDAHATGRIAIDAAAGPAVDLALQINRIDLDRWFPKAAASGVPGNGPPPDTARTTAPVLPPSLRLNVDLGAEIVSWRGGIARQTRLNAVLDHGVIEINRATTLLPGAADLMITGKIGGLDSDPVFDGDLEAEADNLRGMLDWLGIDPRTVPADRLRKASLSSRLNLDRHTAEITGLDLELDGSKIRGAATVALRDRPAIGLRLVADQVNLDAYLGTDAAQRQPAPAAGVPPVDLNLDLTVDTVIYRGEPVRGVHLAGAMQDGALTVKEAKATDFAGATVTISGVVGTPSTAATSLDTTIDIAGAELARLLRVANPDLGPAGMRLGAFHLTGRGIGNGGSITLDLALEALGGSAKVTGSAKAETGRWLDGAARFNARLDAAHPGFQRLAGAIWPRYRPAGTDLGVATLGVSAAGDLTPGKRRVVLDDLSVAVGGQTIKGTATMMLDGPRPRIDADLAVGWIAVEGFLPVHRPASARQAAAMQPGRGPIDLTEWSPEPYDLSLLRAFDGTLHLTGERIGWRRYGVAQPDLRATLEAGHLAVPSLEGRLYGGPISGSFDLVAEGVPAAKFDLTVKGAKLGSLSAGHSGESPIDGDLSGQIAVTAQGTSEVEMVSSLSGTASAETRNGTLHGLGLPVLIARLANLSGPQDLLDLPKALIASDSTTPFSQLDATARIDNGMLRTDDLHLVSTAGEGRGTAAIDLPAYTVTGRLQVNPSNPPGMQPITVQFEGNLDEPKVDVDLKPFQALLAVPGKLERSFEDTLKSLLPSR